MSSIDELFGHFLPTTVVGSYPTETVEEAVADQIEAGIEYVSTGQVCMYKTNMTQPFFEAMENVKIVSLLEKDVPLLGRISLKGDISTIGVIEEVNQAERILSGIKKGQGKKEVKGILTGPSTIVWAIPSFGLGSYKSHKNLLEDLSEIITALAQEMIKKGVSFIQIDEPIFSRYPKLVDAGAKAVSAICENIDAKIIALHVCGELSSSLFKQLASISGIDILDHEFSEFPNNFKFIKKKILIEMEKNLGLGVINKSINQVESVEEVKELIEKGINDFGAEKIVIDPDCGLRSLERDIAKRKLGVMVEATQEIKKEKGLD